MSNDSLFNAFARSYEARNESDMSMAEYLESCRGDPMRYANAAERLLAAIGEPQMIDTAKDARLGRIFLNRTMRAYAAFARFYGMEETIERIVGFFRHAAQGLEERKQILYLLGPVGGGKSSLAERLKSLMEVHPIYVLKAGDELSPVFESPLSLFDPESLGPMIEEKYGIPCRRLSGLMSPWCYKRLEAFGGDISRFRVARIQPSRLRQIAIAKTEPGDENNQDISSLVGKVDIRKLETFAQNDPDAYSYSGGLNRANQGILEFVEMFKAPIKMLHPLLTATQEGNYIGTENIGAVPFTGVILAHSNESEWQNFKANKNNEAFIDRICVIKVPYCLRVTEEQKIYEKLISGSELASAPCAPATLETLARFSVMSRLRKHENSTLFAKMRVYDGESLKESDPKARSVQEYKDTAGVDEGMDGVSTRFAFKVLAATLQSRHRGAWCRSGPSDVCARAVDPPRAAARGNRKALPRIHQGRARAALCGIHRPRDPESLSGILFGLRSKPVRSLRGLCRCLDRRSGLQGPRYRPDAQSQPSQPGTDQDREACGHRQPEGLPQRGRQILAAVEGTEQRQKPVLDQL